MMLTREFREAAAFILGGLGFLHELIIAHGDRPFLLTASLTLMGFPLVFRSDQFLAKKRNSMNPDIEVQKENDQSS